MPSFDTDTTDKITLLRGLMALGTTPEVHELVKIAWTSDPVDTVYYSVQQTDVVAKSVRNRRMKSLRQHDGDRRLHFLQRTNERR